MRRAGSVLLAVVACAALVSACTTGLIAGAVPHSLEHDRQIAADFARARAFVAAFEAREGRPPSPDAFAAWVAREELHSRMELSRHVPAEAIAALGEPPEDAYVLMVWRGEWMEYGAGWSSETTVPTRRADYFVTGSALLDIVAFTLLGAGAGVGAWAAWPRRA